MAQNNLWQQNNFFKEKFINIGNWNFTSIQKFSHCKYLSADTETKLYYKDELLQENDAYYLYKIFGAKWCRSHIVVKTYAFMISDGENFALFQNIEDFLLCCAMMLVEKIFWYNTKFDFSIFDYYFLTNGWKTSEEIVKLFNGNKHKICDKTFQSLNGEYGQRYQLRIWKSYYNSSYHKKVHNFKMIDICNIFAGGLSKNLNDWNILDSSGEEVRKLHMDYANATIENDLQYMINDTKGLHLLAQKINDTLLEISGFSLFDGDFITAGGLAKKSLLKFMFKENKMSENLKLFRKFFPMTVEEDKNFRDFKLYQGGKCIVSPYYVNKNLHNIYKYDINSMYPTQMKNMRYPVGQGKKVKKISKDETKLYVLKIKNAYGYLKKDMIPIWYDNLLKDYVMQIREEESQYFWLEELQMIEKYYELEYDIEEILEYDGYYMFGAKEYVDTFYKIKKNSKGAIRNGAKLFLNSAYGKLAERIETCQCDYKLDADGYVHLVKGEEKIDEKKMMSVLVGSRITALSRVLLMDYILKICKGNPKKYFVYCDTDSVHSLCEFTDTDSSELGKMKSEGVYEFGKYLAPKTYMLYNNLEENTKEFEIHTKGVNTDVVKEKIEQEFNEWQDLEKIANEWFRPGVEYKCLTSLNCLGGKALIMIDKMLLNPKREKETLDDDELID